MGYNKILVIGNLGGAPEMRYTPEGKAVANFSVACNRRWHDKDNNLVEDTEWFRIVVWGKQAESCNQYLDKGRQVFIEGRISTHEYTDKDGVTRRQSEVIASAVHYLGSPKTEDAIPVDASGTSEEATENVRKAFAEAKKVQSNRKIVKKS
ncbi:hypothetical protein A2Z67_01760 [Candidatus Woesebacteria bacterium RBG_13_36_22]|uniref:Single-stranded DNA-binding protein n=1 Tax=Candidatus Woesebacteria bacterium RBG_13_36_22 TaxID=1802478 RepID=A0A1F7X0M2_9BACT|nr:MAG: hypothetical protein A2Z67_01760 [Candidatus Woesebacteria bacterium RBG_13_36_22]